MPARAAGSGRRRARSRTRRPSLHSIAMGLRRRDGSRSDEPDDEPGDVGPTTTTPISPRRRSRTRSTGCGCTRASSRRSSATSAHARPKPVWTTTLVAGAAGRDPDARRARARSARSGGRRDHASERERRAHEHADRDCAGGRGRGRRLGRRGQRARQATARAAARACACRKTGEILTSDRLVGDATKVDVTTADGVVHHARVVGRDSTTDLVLLGARRRDPSDGERTHRDLARCPRRSRRTRPEAGDTVWVVGAPSPGDTSPWMSSGLVASTDSLVVGRERADHERPARDRGRFEPGSSGGALVDRAGDVTGIVLSPVGDDRMTYAVPISTALSVANDAPRARLRARTARSGINGIDASDGPTVTERGRRRARPPRPACTSATSSRRSTTTRCTRWTT